MMNNTEEERGVRFMETNRNYNRMKRLYKVITLYLELELQLLYKDTCNKRTHQRDFNT